MIISIQNHQIVSCHAVREPQLLRLTSGELLLTYHIQPDMHFAERCGMRSTDGGCTWQEEPRRAHREQVIGCNANGLVLAADIYTFERKPGEYIGSYFKSADGGATFAGPYELTVNVNRIASTPYPGEEHFPPDNHPLCNFYQPIPEYYTSTIDHASRSLGPIFWRYFIEHNGRWLAAMQCRYHGDHFYRTILVASDDMGDTWHFVSSIAGIQKDLPAAGDGYCEPVLQSAADGSLLCVMRRGPNLPLAQCRSRDHGQTWSPPELLIGHGVDPDLFLMSNGMLACTYGRPGLHIMFSPDGCGNAWGYRTLIGEWPGSKYMGIAEIAPNELLLVYDRTEPGCGRDPGKCYVGSCHVVVR